MVKDHSTRDLDPSIRLSVLIVTYNSADTIQACVASLIPELQAIQGEIIIVDNCSTDSTPKLLESLADQYSQLFVELNTVNRGFAAGNNQALNRAVGQHILILNPDTEVHANTLAGLLTELEQNEQIAIVAPQLKFPDGRIQKTCRRLPRHMDVVYHTFGLAQLFQESAHFNAWKMGEFEHDRRCQVDQPAGAALLINGSVLRELRGFDSNFPMFFNDVDLCKRVKDSGYEIWYLPEYTMTHVGGASVKQAKVKMMLSSHVSFFRYFEKHFTRLHQQPLNFLVGVLLYLSLIPRILFLLLFAGKSRLERDTL